MVYTKLVCHFVQIAQKSVQAIWFEFPLYLFTLLLWISESVREWNGVLCLRDNPHFIDYFGRFCIVFTWSSIFVWIVSLFKPKVFFRSLFYIVVIGLFLVCIFLRKTTGMDITPSALQLLCETDLREASDFFYTYVFNFDGILLLFLILGAILFVSIIELCWKRVRMKKKPFPFYLVFAYYTIFLVGLYLFNTYYTMAKQTDQEKLVNWFVASEPAPHDPMSKLLYSFKTLSLVNRQVDMSVESTYTYLNTEVPTTSEDSLYVILVIGESYIIRHSSLYGYKLQTTPNLEKEMNNGNLVPYTNAYSSMAITTAAMKQILFTGVYSKTRWYNGVFLPAIFKKTGFYVTLLDNQNSMGTGAEKTGKDYMVLSPMYNKQMAAMSYDETNDKDFQYDEELLSLYNSKNDRNSFVIFHLRGQHFKPKQRFPQIAKFKKFNKKNYQNRTETWMNDDKRQVIADYDNATYYNDYVMCKIIDLFRNKKAVLVYLSDHGAECYDYRDNDKRREGNEPQQMELLHHVPFMVWMSDNYKKSYPDIVNDVIACCDRRFLTDVLPQIMIHLGHVNTSLYVPEEDPLNSKFNQHKN